MIGTCGLASALANASALSPKMSSITEVIDQHITCIRLQHSHHPDTAADLTSSDASFDCSSFSGTNRITKTQAYRLRGQLSAMTEVQTPVAPDQQLEETGKAQYSFNFSDFLRREYRFGLDPNRPSCKAYLQGHCPLGSRCPDKHHVSSSYNKCVFIINSVC